LLKSYKPKRHFLFLFVAILFLKFLFCQSNCIIEDFFSALFFFFDVLGELGNALSAKVVGDHQEKSWFAYQVVWHLVTALFVETYFHPVFAFVTGKVENDVVAVGVRNDIGALTLVDKDKAGLVELKLTDED